MILGIDISTSITGFAIVNNGNLISYDSIDLRKYKDVFAKSIHIKSKILDIYEQYDKFDRIYIEQPFTFFNSGGSSAKTMASLQRFNGIVSWMVYEIFEMQPEYIGASQARKLCDIKVPKGEKAKLVVLEHLLETEESFSVEYTKSGNPKPESFDRADAIVIAKAGYELTKQ